MSAPRERERERERDREREREREREGGEPKSDSCEQVGKGGGSQPSADVGIEKK